MRRVKASFSYQASEWESRTQNVNWDTPGGKDYEAGVLYSIDKAVIGGRVAFAQEQAAQFREMREFCEMAWQNVPKYVKSLGKDPIVPKEVEAKLGIFRKAEKGKEGESDDEEEEKSSQPN
jgi:hypothetical protein